MGWKTHAFYCEDCKLNYDDIFWKDAGTADDPALVMECPGCGEDNITCIGTPGIGRYSIMDHADRKASMRKRSADHSKRMMKKNAEKFGLK